MSDATPPAADEIGMEPCPFCDGPAKLIRPMGDFVGKGLGHNGGAYKSARYRVVCAGLYETPTRDCPSRGCQDTEAEAIAAWNTRRPATNP